MKILIRLYRLLISPLVGDCCRFYPSCSLYALEAVDRFGTFKGGWMTIKRLAKCAPWHPGGYDPVLNEVEDVDRDSEPHLDHDQKDNDPL